ncbi:PD-(D/E)XK motif protein, partial [Klebsiella pneumoniae]|uniref:PD-(D/E)XK motif protein n=1 Tax=Klebsiella pneumoniae TaxID=573 RepID=UPI0025A0CCDB
MWVLEFKLKTDPSAEWTAIRMGSRDIECAEEICEVKSTCKRYGAEITIAGQHQLVHKKPLYLYFVRMEESVEGISVNDMKNRLIQAGYDP